MTTPRSGKGRRKEKEQQTAGSDTSRDGGIPLNAIYGHTLEGKQKDNRIRSLEPQPVLDASSDAAFHFALRVFIAGDSQRIDMTDTRVEKLVKACPSPTTITLHETYKRAARIAFSTILKGCTNIKTLTLTVVKGRRSKRTQLSSAIDWLTDEDFVPKLRFLEFRGVPRCRLCLSVTGRLCVFGIRRASRFRELMAVAVVTRS
ncbi:hypothetical protein BDW02DRAFT_185770 [Decorospora gaudefroyi]|uniref:Uncharacterized protein n=1 Tax=Decorospora gaudefroyi TaxID=184978 RepID=A0A6A5JZ71_9PLEO|nr:hypothetical protein BDW02DRAFT_185770 [Decorospora gaudefroyi]